MNDRIDRTSPVPLYHQIAEALRNGIAVGELEPGARLPSVRDAAGQWGVNLHTVRKAYRELEREGLVNMSGGRGTEVVQRPVHPGDAELTAFLASCAESARARFGLSAPVLAELLLRRESAGGAPVVHFLECSRTQALGHCAELEKAWAVRAEPIVLHEVEALPAGVVVATYFHYNEVRQRWPQRLDGIRFVAIAPDPSLPGRLPQGFPNGDQRLLVCELDTAKAKNIAADLQVLFPTEQHVIEPRVLSSPAELPDPADGEVVLVAPRVWAALSEEQRARAVEIRYMIRVHELESLGASLGWARAPNGGG
jgi:DNA-binding transcriptional regulator YhcF (GntR family)